MNVQIYFLAPYEKVIFIYYISQIVIYYWNMK